MDPVRKQYERYPYPPIPWMALPEITEADRADYLPRPLPERPNILVLGCGTMEVVAIARLFPNARKIVAIDLSERALRNAKRRYRLARVANWIPGRPRIASVIHFIHGDFTSLTVQQTIEAHGLFDLVVASNVLHHLDSPALALNWLKKWLTPKGLIRITTYPKYSRLWMRALSRHFARSGLNARSENLVQRIEKLLKNQAPTSPLLSTWLACSERSSTAGVVDAFFHPRENILSPLEWHHACAQAGLSLLAEKQEELCRSTALDQVAPEASKFSPWLKLEILDSLWELTSNPVLWFERGDTSPVEPPLRKSTLSHEDFNFPPYLGEDPYLPLHWADSFVDVLEVTRKLHARDGLRSSGQEMFPGLTLAEYLK